MEKNMYVVLQTFFKYVLNCEYKKIGKLMKTIS